MGDSIRVVLIDPHVHTRHSDGTDSPTELIAAAVAAGLDVVGISDHDTTAGWSEAARAAREAGIALIPGVEVSSQWQGRPVHILGLLVDDLDQRMQKAFQDARTSRRERLGRMVANMAGDFSGLVWENVEERAGGAPLGRPHLADELVALGYFDSRADAFATALSPRGPYWERQHTMSPAAAVELVRSAGGVPILAHPQATRRARPVAQEVVEEMVDAGLFALELDHRDHNDADRAEVARLARHFGLETTGGSDYHGRGKPNLIGENVTSEPVFEKIQAEARGKVIWS